MIRRLLFAAMIVLVTAGAALAGWHYLRPRDPLAQARQMMDQGNIRGAQLVLRSAVLANPGLAEAHVRLGKVQLLLSDPAAAEHEFRQAAALHWDAAALRPLLAQAVVAQGRYAEVLKDYPADGLPPADAATVLVARAQAQLGLDQPEAAAASVAEAQRLAPKSAAVALASARVAIAGKDLDAAARHVAEALAIDPHDLQALSLQAELQAARGDFSGAVTTYGTAIDQAQAAAAPGVADMLRLGRARALYATGAYLRARSDVDTVLKTQPRQPQAQYLSALLYTRAGDWKAADAALSEIAPLLPRLPDGELTLAVVKANLGEPEQAVAAAEQQVAQTPGNLGAVKLLAMLEMSKHEPGRAADLLATTLGNGHTLDAQALDLLGAAYAGAGQPGQAVAALQQAIALKPDDARLLTRLAAMEMRNGDAPQAEQALQRALAAMPQASAPGPVVPASAEAPTAQAAKAGPSEAQTAAALVLAALRAGDLAGATAALDQLRHAGGSPAEVATLQGAIRLAAVDLDGARAAYEDAIRLDPKAVAPRISLARVMALQGHGDEAIARLQAMLAADPGNAQILAAMVNLQLAAGRKDAALAATEAAHRAAPDNSAITIGLATLYLRTGQPQETLDLLAKSKPASGGAAAAMLRLRAEAELGLGQRGAAVQTMRTLLAQTPRDDLLRRQIADLLAADQKYDDAQVVLQEGLVLQPGDPALMAAEIGVAQRAGGPSAAMARADALARDPANPAAAVLRGDLLASEGHFAEAIAVYQALQAKQPKDSPEAAVLEVRVARALAASGGADRGAAMLRDWLAAHPKDANAAFALASFDIAANRLPEAQERLDTVLALQPNNVAALNNLAWVMQKQGDLARARALASRAYLLRAAPQSADTLGWIILAQGQSAGAVALLREAAAGMPQDPAIQYHLAAALARDGDKGAAVTILKPLLDKPNPGFAEQPQAAKLLADLTH